jgi:hypothetical protein
MGFAPSPYNSIKMAMIVEEVAKGDRRQVGKGKDGRDPLPVGVGEIKSSWHTELRSLHVVVV